MFLQNTVKGGQSDTKIARACLLIHTLSVFLLLTITLLTPSLDTHYLPHVRYRLETERLYSCMP